MKNKVLHILIAETDEWFLSKLKEVFNELRYEFQETTFSLTEARNMAEIKTAFRKIPLDFALMEHRFFAGTNHLKHIISMIQKSGKHCGFVMLISYGIDKKIARVLDNINRNPSLDLVGYILKENYPKDLIRVLLKFFINKNHH